MSSLSRSRANGRRIILGHPFENRVPDARERNETDSLLETQVRQCFRVLQHLHLRIDQPFAALALARQHGIIHLVSSRIPEGVQRIRGGKYNFAVLRLERPDQLLGRGFGPHLP